MGTTIIDNEEYKDLILKEKELEDLTIKYQKEVYNHDNEKVKLLLEQKKFKDFLLLCVKNKISSYREYENYDIAEEEIADHINENYIDQIPLWIKEKEQN